MRSALVAVLCFVAAPAFAEVVPGPYPDTVLSRNGQLVWYVGVIPLEGHRWRDMDRLCAAVPVRQISGWRAPWMVELQSLLVERPYSTGMGFTDRLFFANETLMATAIPPFVREARGHPQVNLLSRNLWTYAGDPTTLAQADRAGGMHHVQWYNRSTNPFVDVGHSTRYTPGDSPLGGADRLLCVAEVGP